MRLSSARFAVDLKNLPNLASLQPVDASNLAANVDWE